MYQENIKPNNPAGNELNVKDVTKYKLVMFHLETTGFEKDSNILKLSALTAEDNFEAFLTPKIPIPKIVTQKNYLEVKEERLCFRGQPVDEGPPKKQLYRFKEWLEGFEIPVVLVGHNCRSFIAPHFIFTLKEHGLEEAFRGIVVGFVDSISLAKKVFPDRKKYSLDILVNDLVGCTYDAHTGLENVNILQKVVKELLSAIPQLQGEALLDKCSFTYQFAVIRYPTASKCEATKRGRREKTGIPPAKRALLDRIRSSEIEKLNVFE